MSSGTSVTATIPRVKAGRIARLVTDYTTTTTNTRL
jgi:hypothetical protein